MSPERRLAAALDRAEAPVRFWWRDDDAGADDERLLPLLRVAERRRAPVALAVVPDWLAEPCRSLILASQGTIVLQHGIAHTNHAPPGARKIELGGSARRDTLLADLRRGRERLARAFGERFVRVLVPPWNRIAPDLLPQLARAGFTGISTFGAARADPAPGLRRVNTHLDLVAWRAGGRSLTLSEAVERLTGLVLARMAEPIGILSHHQVMNPASFSTLDRLLALVQDHPRATLATAGSLFGEGG